MGNINVQRHADRAMQFAPFAALKGYYECVRMQERITEPKKELSEDEAEALSSTLKTSSRLVLLSKSDITTLMLNVEKDKLKQTIQAIRAIHPYEEPLINVIRLYSE